MPLAVRRRRAARSRLRPPDPRRERRALAAASRLRRRTRVDLDRRRACRASSRARRELLLRRDRAASRDRVLLLACATIAAVSAATCRCSVRVARALRTSRLRARLQLVGDVLVLPPICAKYSTSSSIASHARRRETTSTAFDAGPRTLDEPALERAERDAYSRRIRTSLRVCSVKSAFSWSSRRCVRELHLELSSLLAPHDLAPRASGSCVDDRRSLREHGLLRLRARDLALQRRDALVDVRFCRWMSSPAAGVASEQRAEGTGAGGVPSRGDFVRSGRTPAVVLASGLRPSAGRCAGSAPRARCSPCGLGSVGRRSPSSGGGFARAPARAVGASIGRLTRRRLVAASPRCGVASSRSSPSRRRDRRSSARASRTRAAPPRSARSSSAHEPRGADRERARSRSRAGCLARRARARGFRPRDAEEERRARRGTSAASTSAATQCARSASAIAIASVAVAIPKSSVGGVMPK